MKNQIILSALVLLCVGLCVSSCKKPDEGLEYIFTSPEITTAIGVVVINAATEEQLGIDIDNFKIDVSIEGPDKGSVVNNQGDPEIACVKGMLSVALKPGIVPSESKPVKFNVIFKKSGYISTSLAVRLTEPGYTSHIVKMVDLNNLPDGVATVQNTQISTNASGVTQSQVSFSTPTPQSAGELTKASLTVPAGTVMLDENMQPVSGTVTARMTYFNPSDESSLQSFPGGFMVEADGQEVIFKSGGFVALDMSAGGKEIKHFGTNAISMTLEIPANTSNYDGTPIQVGMSIPIWSYNPNTGQWHNEGDQTISFNAVSQKFEVTFPMTHLSYWNTDWQGTACAGGRKFTINSNLTGDQELGFNVYNNGEWVAVGEQNFKNGSSFSLSPYPTVATTWKIVNYSPSGSNVLEVSVPGGCNNAEIAVTFTVPKPIEIDLEYVCTSKNTVYKPWMPIYYRVDGEPKVYKFAGYMINGKIHSNCFYYGVPYKIATMFGTTVVESPDIFTASKPYHKMTINTCP